MKTRGKAWILLSMENAEKRGRLLEIKKIPEQRRKASLTTNNGSICFTGKIRRAKNPVKIAIQTLSPKPHLIYSYVRVR